MANISKKNNILSITKHVFNMLGAPLIHELPFFIITSCYFCIFDTIIGSTHTSITSIRLIVLRCSIGLLFSYITTSIAYLTRNKIAKASVYCFLFTIMLIDLHLKANVHTGIGAEAIRLVAETNNSEASEYISSYLFSSDSIHAYIKLGIYAISFLILSIAYKKYRKFITHQIANTINCFAITILTLGLYFCNCFVEMFQYSTTELMMSFTEGYKLSDPISRIIVGIKTLSVSGKEINNAISANEAIKPCNDIIDDNPINIVVVIGESFIKWHTPIYGYNLNTTPNLCRELANGNMTAFYNATTPNSQTSYVIKNILSCNSTTNNELWYNFPIFPTIFKQKGWTVSMYDNQKNCQQGSMWSFALNTFLYNKRLSKMAFTNTNNNSFTYDGELIDTYLPHIKPGHNLVLFHLMGQHHNAEKRYPQNTNFNHFTCDSINRNEPWLDDIKKTTIANYDNATYYNDNVLSKIFNYFEDSNSIVIYLSDHGEEVYDYRDSLGKRLSETITQNKIKYLFQIPFFVWYSSKYKELHPDKINSLEKAMTKPFSSENLCHLLFSLADIQTEYYCPERDVSNISYSCNKRAIYLGSKKYILK